jgi:tetratricopeptide (TPR) repeat protein
VSRVEALKQEGNQAFGHGNFDEAKTIYQKALDICPSEQQPELAAMLWANMAACELKQASIMPRIDKSMVIYRV